MNDDIVRWASNELGIKLSQRELASLLTSKNGRLYSKLFAFFVDSIKSSKNDVKEVAECARLAEELKNLQLGVAKLEKDMRELLSSYAAKENTKHDVNLKQKQQKGREYFVDMMSDIIGEVVSLRAMGVSTSYANSSVEDFSDIPELTAESGLLREEEVDSRYVENDIGDQINMINTLVEDINEILHEIANVDVSRAQEESFTLGEEELSLLREHSCFFGPPNRESSQSEIADMISEVERARHRYIEARSEVLEAVKEKIDRAMNMIHESATSASEQST